MTFLWYAQRLLPFCRRREVEKLFTVCEISEVSSGAAWEGIYNNIVHTFQLCPKQSHTLLSVPVYRSQLTNTKIIQWYITWGLCVCMCVRVSVRAGARARVCVCVYVRARARARVCVCVCVCVCVLINDQKTGSLTISPIIMTSLQHKTLIIFTFTEAAISSLRTQIRVRYGTV